MTCNQARQQGIYQTLDQNIRASRCSWWSTPTCHQQPAPSSFHLLSDNWNGLHNFNVESQDFRVTPNAILFPTLHLSQPWGELRNRILICSRRTSYHLIRSAGGRRFHLIIRIGRFLSSRITKETCGDLCRNLLLTLLACNENPAYRCWTNGWSRQPRNRQPYWCFRRSKARLLRQWQTTRGVRPRICIVCRKCVS